ncbi:hypothetical protein C5167_046180 [Papaver somniferum]|uniref:Uncharacterized protein n=1 Tax=Papaver somniferum TaxID=3469 RepID=A0A4Y7LGH8_PAPSO|nr:hypothetical protein C5167_046180 [Papaver somniferum]
MGILINFRKSPPPPAQRDIRINRKSCKETDKRADGYAAD